MTENFWKDKYPAGIASEINPDQYPNIQAVLKQSCQRFADKPAFSNLGKTLTYAELYELSGNFAAYLQQHTDLQPGDRIAVQMPNILQYPIVVFGAIRAGLVVVNTNPLYTAREMEHQFNDSGAKALICLANMAHLAEQVVPKTGVKTVIVTEEEDLVGRLQKVTEGRGVDVVLDACGGSQMKLLGDVMAPLGKLILYGMNGGNETALPVCAAFKKNFKFFLHCLCDFTGQPELGIEQNREAVERALQHINQLTVDRLIWPQLDRQFPFEQAVEAHQYVESGVPRGRVVLTLN